MLAVSLYANSVGLLFDLELVPRDLPQGVIGLLLPLILQARLLEFRILPGSCYRSHQAVSHWSIDIGVIGIFIIILTHSGVNPYSVVTDTYIWGRIKYYLLNKSTLLCASSTFLDNG